MTKITTELRGELAPKVEADLRKELAPKVEADLRAEKDAAIEEEATRKRERRLADVNREVEARRAQQMAVLEAEKKQKRAEMLAGVEAEKAERLRLVSDETLPPPHGLPAIRPEELFGYQDHHADRGRVSSPFAPSVRRQPVEDNNTVFHTGPTTARHGAPSDAQANASAFTTPYTRRQPVKQEPDMSPGLAQQGNPDDAQANDTPAPATTAAAPEKRKRGRPVGTNKAKSSAVQTGRVTKKSATIEAPRKLRSGALYESLVNHEDEDKEA